METLTITSLLSNKRTDKGYKWTVRWRDTQGGIQKGPKCKSSCPRGFGVCEAQGCMTLSYTVCLCVCVCVCVYESLSCVWLFVPPWTVTHQSPLSMGFSRQEHWSGLPFPSPGDLPHPGIKPRSPALHVDSLPSEPPEKPLLHDSSGIFMEASSWKRNWLLTQFFWAPSLPWRVRSGDETSKLPEPSSLIVFRARLANTSTASFSRDEAEEWGFSVSASCDAITDR